MAVGRSGSHAREPPYRPGVRRTAPLLLLLPLLAACGQATPAPDSARAATGRTTADPAALLAGVAMLPEEVTSWSATGIGRTHLPVLAAALAAGGHLRVGMEDNVVFARGQEVQHNVELVARAAELATTLQRPPMSTAQARDLLAIKPRR